MGLKEKYEEHHNVTYTNNAIEACVNLSERYITDRFLPDKAIDVLDEAGARAHMFNDKVPKNIINIEKKIDSLRSEKEMIDLFPSSMAAINNSQYLAERCKTDWTYSNTIFPNLSLKNTHRANKTLRSLVTTGAQKRYGNINGLLKERINYELSLIIQKGFAPYFLIVRDIVQQTKSTIGRGSGAASWTGARSLWPLSLIHI